MTDSRVLMTASIGNRSDGDSESNPTTGAFERSLPVDPELAGLLRHRRREARRHQAQMAQICRHPDPTEAASGLAQQRIWALRRARERRLKLSDLAMVRRCC